MMNRKTKIEINVVPLIIILLLTSLIVIGSSFSLFFKFGKILDGQSEETLSLLTTHNINSEIFKLIERGQEKQVYDFYDKIIGNKKITYLIVTNALVNGIPVNLFMSLAYTESRYCETAIGKNLNSAGEISSYDYGLFQLNSNTFKEYTREYLLDPENNARLAAQHLLELYKRYGTWYEATLGYNAGNTLLIKNKTVKHFVSVLSFQEELDTKFVLEL